MEWGPAELKAWKFLTNLGNILTLSGLPRLAAWLGYLDWQRIFGSKNLTWKLHHWKTSSEKLAIKQYLQFLNVKWYYFFYFFCLWIRGTEAVNVGAQLNHNSSKKSPKFFFTGMSTAKCQNVTGNGILKFKLTFHDTLALSRKMIQLLALASRLLSTYWCPFA